MGVPEGRASTRYRLRVPSGRLIVACGIQLIVTPRNQLTPQGLSPHPLLCLWLVKGGDRVCPPEGLRMLRTHRRGWEAMDLGSENSVLNDHSPHDL